MILHNQNNVVSGDLNSDKKAETYKEKENYLEFPSMENDLPAKSLTELEQDYYNTLQSDNSN